MKGQVTVAMGEFGVLVRDLEAGKEGIYLRLTVVLCVEEKMD
jgi:hypothetical protein